MNKDDLAELKTNTRVYVIETLELIASKEEQLDYQASVPIAWVAQELFSDWEGAYQIPFGQKWYQETFSKRELDIFSDFNSIFAEVSETIGDKLPPTEEFIETPEWGKLAAAAQSALAKLKKTNS